MRSLNCGGGGRGQAWGPGGHGLLLLSPLCSLPGPVKRPHMEEATGHWSLRPAFRRPLLCGSICGPADCISIWRGQLRSPSGSWKYVQASVCRPPRDASDSPPPRSTSALPAPPSVDFPNPPPNCAPTSVPVPRGSESPHF